MTLSNNILPTISIFILSLDVTLWFFSALQYDDIHNVAGKNLKSKKAIKIIEKKLLILNET